MTNQTLRSGYPKKEAVVYDKKRFSDPKGKLFNELEMGMLEKAFNYLPPSQKVLEVGCGTGRFILKNLKESHEIHAIDLSPFMLFEASKKTSNYNSVNYYYADGTKLPFKNDIFDLVYSIRVIDHLPTKNAALDMIYEMIRVCKNRRFILVEFINKWSLSFFKKDRSVLLSIVDIKSIINDLPSVQILDTNGILFFSQTIMNGVPATFLNIFKKIDQFMSKFLPQYSTRCYVLLQKKA